MGTDGHTLSQNGLLSALPNLATWLTAVLSGWLSDWLIRTGRVSIPVHRKTVTTLCTHSIGGKLFF